MEQTIQFSYSQFVYFSVICAVVYGVALYSAIRRLQKRLGPDANPTVWTYVNELGGYLVVGIVGVISFVWRLAFS